MLSYVCLDPLDVILSLSHDEGILKERERVREREREIPAFCTNVHVLARLSVAPELLSIRKKVFGLVN